MSPLKRSISAEKEVHGTESHLANVLVIESIL